MSLLLFSGAGWGVCTSALIMQLLTLLSESEPVREAERGCGETSDRVVYQSFIEPLCSHRRVTSDCGSASHGALQLRKRQHVSTEEDNLHRFLQKTGLL